MTSRVALPDPVSFALSGSKVEWGLDPSPTPREGGLLPTDAEVDVDGAVVVALLAFSVPF